MNENTNKGGIGFTGLLQIAFIVLKLCGVIDWSWWLVLSPILICCGIALCAILIGLVIGTVKVIKKKKLKLNK